MRNLGVEEGFRKTIVVKRGWNVSTGSGAKSIVPLDDIPCEDSGLEVCINALEIRLPTLSWTLAAGKASDFVSIAQAISAMSLFYAADAPPAAHPSGAQSMFESVDGYRLFQALTFLSNRPAMLASGASMHQFDATVAADVTDPTSIAMAAHTWQTRMGWLQQAGLVVADNAAGASVSFTPVFYLNFGYHYGEKASATAIPARWFNGRALGKGCGGKQAGRLEFVLGQTIDNVAATWTGNTADIFAHCSLVPKNKIPCPATPRIVVNSSSNKIQKFPPGIRKLLVLMKGLTSGGAMQTESYTRVAAKCGGRDIIESDMTQHLSFVSEGVNREEFRTTFNQVTITGNVTAVRKSRAGTPLILHDGPNVTAPGSLDEETVLDFQSTGESSFDSLDMYLVPNTDEVRAKAEQYAGGGTTLANTANGNKPAPAQAAMLPATVHSPIGDKEKGKS